jgi:hypothetical protein
MEPTPEIKELNKAFGSEIEELREELLYVDNRRRSGIIGLETARQLENDLDRAVRATEKAWHLAVEAVKNPTLHFKDVTNSITTEGLTPAPESRRVIVIIGGPNGLTKESIPLDKAGDWYNRFQNWQADLVADGRKTISKIVAVSDGYYTKFGDREISFYFSQFNEVNE